MKRLIFAALLAAGSAQAITPKPAPVQAEPIAIVGATVHVGTGAVLENATIAFSDGKSLPSARLLIRPAIDSSTPVAGMCTRASSCPTRTWA